MRARGGAQRRPWGAIAALAAIALLTLILYTCSLARNGMANSYYAAAVKSGTLSGKAFFFGALDPGSFLTVDKPPLSLWVQGLFARVFGFSSWSILVPQALAGVASVLLLHHLVRDWRGEAAGLLAALALALTPVAALIFRYNNPDALLTLLLLLAAWALWSALRTGSTWKLVAAGAALGFAFLTKMLMAALVLPALFCAYLLCGPGKTGRRLWQLAVGAATMIVAGGWWVAIVELWPKATRPYIGGTTTNSVLELAFSRTGGYGGATGTTSNMSGSPSFLRLFNEQLGGQVSWLLPLALLSLLVGLYVHRHRARTDKGRAGYLLWGLWLLVMAVVFSYATGTFHSYYVVVLAPAVAALASAGLVEMWRWGRRNPRPGWLLPVALIATSAWSAVLLGRAENYAPGLRLVVLILGCGGGVGLFVALRGASRSRWLAYAAAAAGLIAMLAGPTAFTLSTVCRSITGNMPYAGPVTTTRGLASSAASADITVDQGLLAYLEAHREGATFLVAVQDTSVSVPIILATGEPVVTIGGYKQRDPTPTVAQLASLVETGQLRYAFLTDSGLSSVAAKARSSAAADTTAATIAQVVQWITDHGVAVAASAYGGPTSAGTLYQLE